MRKNSFQFCFYGAIALGLIGAPATNADADASIWKCVKRDLQILMLVDERTTGTSGQKMGEAMFAIVTARMACLEGRVRDSLALYDDISRNIALDTGRTSRWRVEPFGEDPASTR